MKDGVGGIGKFEVESKPDSPDDADCDDMATMSNAGRMRQGKTASKKQVKGGEGRELLENSCDWRLQPLPISC